MTDIGVQTFTIRKQQKKDLRQAYLALTRLGIRDLEIARIHFDDKSGRRVADLMRKLGIRVAAIQVKPRHVFGAVEDVVAFCNQTGCRRVVISQLPFSCILGSEQKFYDFVAKLDRQHAIYAAHGIELAYHHHNWEYITLSCGKTRMDVLLEETKNIQFVHDTYWTTKCGLSSPHQIRRFGNRLMGIHLRDLTLHKKGLQVQSRDGAIGDGVVDFPAVLAAAREVGCGYCVIEQKTPTPYADLQRSYDVCRRILSNMEANVYE